MPADVPCWGPVSYRTLRGGNLLLVPGTPTSQAVCGCGLETPWLPLSRLQDGVSVLVSDKNMYVFPSFQTLILGTYTLLGLLFLPTLSLPVSMATPPNSRFQAAMTSPFPFLPPRPLDAAAWGPGAALFCAPSEQPSAKTPGLQATAEPLCFLLAQ